MKIDSILVVDVGWAHTLRLADDIASCGIKVYLLSNENYSIYWLPKNIIVLPPCSTSSEHVVTSIDIAVKQLSPALILPVSEETLYCIWKASPDWSPLVWPAIDKDQKPLYLSKYLLSKYVQEYGVVIPKSYLLYNFSIDTITAIVDEVGLPVVVKGVCGVAGSQVRIAETYDAVTMAILEIHTNTGQYPALQQCISGKTYLFGGLFDQGRPVCMVCAEKLEMDPPRTGPAILLSNCVEPKLLELGTAVFSALKFTGIASADFIRDKDGEFYFLEVNPRPWGSYGIAKHIGIKLVEMWCRLINGEKLPTTLPYQGKRIWAKMPEYLFAPPVTKRNFFRRLLRLEAIRSWSWHSPQMFIFEVRVAFLKYSEKWRRKMRQVNKQ